MARDREKRNAWEKKWRSENPDKVRASYRRWLAKSSDKRRNSHLLRTYGLTVQDWETRFESQGRRCACCRADSPGTKHNWHVDHNHKTGQVRGILCHACNVMLGHAKDDSARLAAGIEYLAKSLGAS